MDDYIDELDVRMDTIDAAREGRLIQRIESLKAQLATAREQARREENEACAKVPLEMADVEHRTAMEKAFARSINNEIRARVENK